MSWPTNSQRSKTWVTEVLFAGDLDGQLDLLHQYFIDSLNGTSGHAHTGGTNDGTKINIGTGITVTSQAQGDVIYASSSSVFTRLAAGTNGQALTTGGASANPTFAGMTTQGDVEYHNGTTRSRLGAGTAGQVLQSQGAAANPQWAFPSGQLGAWASKTADGTAFQAATDGFVTCYVSTGGGSLVQIDAFTDSSNPPTTKRQSFQTQGATVGGGSIMMPVKKNDYYKVTGGGTMFFIPLGS